MSPPRHCARNPERDRVARRWLLLLLALWFVPGPVRACRYNVRDVGFVDLETDTYHLYAFVRNDTPADLVALLQQLPAAALRDCNVQFETVGPGTPTSHPAFDHRPQGTDDPQPIAVLVSPDGRALPLALRRGNLPFREALTLVLDEVASSPKREQLLATVGRSFAAVLLIEGERAEANDRARQAIDRAIETLRGQMQSLPKPIAAPPALVLLDAAALANERILLWSLRLDTARTAQPRAAIVYGRARWIGPLMQGDEISEPNLVGLLSMIGADCECGLDVAWTLGTRLPVRWDETRHTGIAKALGFDPESPLVKVEVSRIATRAVSTRATPATAQPVVLSSDPRPSADTLRADASAAPVGGASVFSRAWRFVGVMAVVVLSIGLFFLWKAGHR